MIESMWMEPGQETRLGAEGLGGFAAFFQKADGVKVSDHRHRDVLRIALADGWAFLKRQYRIRWKERFASWWAGFGFVSKSRREWRILHALKAAGFGCPEPLAVGETTDRAFLLVRGLPEAIDLPTFLGQENLSGECGRVELARTMGTTLARFHRAGFTHPDLYSKHVFVHLDEGTISFIDYQRTRLRGKVSWRQRWRDLAALDASLSEELANGRERIICLAAYVRTVAPLQWKQRFRQGLWAIMKRSAYLLRKPRIRKMREMGLRPVDHVLFQRFVVDGGFTDIQRMGLPSAASTGPAERDEVNAAA